MHPTNPQAAPGPLREAPPSAECAAAPRPARPVRVLLVDDEAGVRSFLRAVLAKAGYEITELADGRQVLREVLARQIDLVITDLVMPDQEGIETIRELRRHAPGVRIIAMSGAFGGEFLNVARMIGAQAVLKKPVEPEDILKTVNEILKS
jgi:DNA-binding response OmpR family regulator